MSSISNHKYEFSPKLHDPKFNYRFIRSILKSHNLIAYSVIQEVKTTRLWSVPIFIEPCCLIYQFAFFSFIIFIVVVAVVEIKLNKEMFLQCDWLV